MKIKDLILSLTIIVLFIFLLIQRCNNGKYVPQKPDTTYIRDTVQVTVKGATIFKPIPYKVEVPHDSIIYVIDTPKTLLEFRDAYFKAQYQLLSKNYYNDSIFINDTTGLNGWVNIKDTTYKNKLQGRTVRHSLNFPKIKETITITKYPKKKTLWFIGGSVLTNYPVSNIGIEINGGFLNKKNQYYEIGAQSWNNELIYKLGTKIKL
jgi:hypothetical protein